ncbi:MAG TPA: PD-(D/E)XK nuclease family protein [Leadbetterella sp.]|nr:PD-(D/E)XK nuclease family protein [Leadbetterella sp.]
MQSFLETAAQTIFENHQKNDLQHLQVILPSRRAVFFFKKALSNLSEEPFFAPKIASIDDFILTTSGLTTLDNVDIYFEIFEILSSVDSGQSFEKFMSWVPTLLKDFENIDFSLVENPHLLFKYMSEADAISRWELSEDYVFTSTAQSYFSFFDKISIVYEKLKQRLIHAKKCYRGMAYRQVAENPELVLNSELKKYYFVGLNALSKAEEKIIETLEKANKSTCIWDTDDFYMNSQNKAGKKLRAYKRSGKFGKWSFQGNYLKESKKEIRVFELNNDSLQTKLVSELAREYASQKHVIVVLDENQFLPLLLHIPALDLPFNISIGLPISNSKFSEILKLLIECFQNHEHSEEIKIHQTGLLKIIQNPILKYLIISEIGNDRLLQLQENVLKSKRVFFDSNWLKNHNVVSKSLNSFLLKGNVKLCIEAINGLVDSFFELQIQNFSEIEFIFANILKNKINLVSEKMKSGIDLNFKSFRALIDDLLKNQRVPFEGDSDTPLQIMSMLETRCLDFDCVTIMTLNEGNLPSAKKSNSFFPFDASKIFGLPLYSDQDAIMAYHFLRLLQRAQKVNFIYLNGASEALGNKEKSRFIRQVEEELTVYNPHVSVSYPNLVFPESGIGSAKNEIIVKKGSTTSIKDFLRNKGLSASSINDFLSCKLRFYWKYLEKIKNEDELKIQIGADVFGTIVHKVLENLDQPYLETGVQIGLEQIKEQKNNIVKELDKAIEEGHKAFDFGSGMNLILLSVVQKILEKYFQKRLDEFSGNFRILGVEKQLNTLYRTETCEVLLKGVIDKVELHSEGLHIVDYKTGKVVPKDLESLKVGDLNDTLLDPDKSKLRQLIIYYFLINSNLVELEKAFGQHISMPHLQLLIYSFRNLSSSLFFDKAPFAHEELIASVENLLQVITDDLLNSNSDFAQTQDKEQCKFCDFTNVCKRA